MSVGTTNTVFTKLQSFTYYFQNLLFSIPPVLLFINFKKIRRPSLPGLAQLVEGSPVKQRVADWIPGQGTCLRFKFCSGQVPCERQPINVALSY